MRCSPLSPPPPSSYPLTHTYLSSSRDEQNWIWHTSEETQLYYDNQETVRFRIEAEHWHDQTPIGPTVKEEEFGGFGIGGGDVGKKSPYTITASMEDPGLGPCLWWDGEDEEDTTLVGHE